MKYHTRIAPSPTGDMHIGTARTAYFNYLAARASGGEFLLRIDDTDLARSRPEYETVVTETLGWLGLNPDHTFKQSDRFDLYRGFARDLVRRGLAEERDGATFLSLRDLDSLPTSWDDSVAGTIRISPEDLTLMRNMTLIKSDGSPTYNFSTVVDDLESGINWIIRGTDHITNTARQVVLWGLLDDGLNRLPRFSHVGLIFKDGKPLSKRDGAASMIAYRDGGYDPDAMLNFLARLGWGPTKDDKSTALLPRDRMVELFLTGGKMRSQPAGFDAAKLNSFDRKYKARKNI